MTRKIVFLIVFCLFVIAMLESISFIFIRLYAHDRYDDVFWYDYEAYVDNIPDSYIEKFRKYSYDKDLGWDVPPNARKTEKNTAGSDWTYTIDSQGFRGNPFRSDKTLISTYGDSYTFGHEVNDNETWPYFLSQLTGTYVLNFGVGAYGIDQALLKLKRNVENGLKTPVVILSVWSWGINRLLKSYRPFFNYEEGMKLAFKPIIVKSGKGFEWVKNPLRELNNRQDIIAALHRAMEHDLWYKSRKIKNEFPYSFRIIELVLAILRDQHKISNNQWSNPDTTEKLEYLIDLFYNHAKEHDYLPVVVFIPNQTELKNRRKGSRATYAEFADDMVGKYNGKKIVFVDIYEKEFEEQLFNVNEFGGHASRYGNRIIAQAIYEKIRGPLKEMQK